LACLAPGSTEGSGKQEKERERRYLEGVRSPGRVVGKRHSVLGWKKNYPLNEGARSSGEKKRTGERVRPPELSVRRSVDHHEVDEDLEYTE